jgi:hypothetical protein
MLRFPVAATVIVFTLSAAPLVPLARPAAAQAPKRASYTVPKPGSKERKVVLDAIRAPLEKELHRPVIFQVRELRLKDGWAFLSAEPQQPSGRPLDYTGTKYAELIKQGMFDSSGLFALLRQKKGRWTVVEYALGPTDVTWDGWDQRHGCPRAILPYPQ